MDTDATSEQESVKPGVPSDTEIEKSLKCTKSEINIKYPKLFLVKQNKQTCGWKLITSRLSKNSKKPLKNKNKVITFH